MLLANIQFIGGIAITSPTPSCGYWFFNRTSRIFVDATNRIAATCNANSP